MEEKRMKGEQQEEGEKTDTEEETVVLACNDDSNIGNESDSDADYDDLDDLVVNSDGDDFMDEDDVGDEDDKSVTSTATTISTGSVGSNTPSVVGESLENFSLEGVQQQGETVKKAWEIRGEEIKHELVSQAPNLTDS